MPGMVVFLVCVAVVVVWGLWGKGLNGPRKGMQIFASLLAGSTHMPDRKSLRGNYGPDEVTVQFGTTTEPWSMSGSVISDVTAITVGGLPDDLHLSLVHRPPNRTRPGYQNTCPTGDERFWIDGQPVERVVALLDAEIRAWLHENNMIELTIDRGSLVLRYFGFLSAGDAPAALACVGAIKKRAAEVSTSPASSSTNPCKIHRFDGAGIG